MGGALETHILFLVCLPQSAGPFLKGPPSHQSWDGESPPSTLPHWMDDKAGEVARTALNTDLEEQLWTKFRLANLFP